MECYVASKICSEFACVDVAKYWWHIVKWSRQDNGTVRQVLCPLEYKTHEGRDHVCLIYLQHLVDTEWAFMNMYGLNVRARKMTWKNKHCIIRVTFLWGSSVGVLLKLVLFIRYISDVSSSLVRKYLFCAFWHLRCVAPNIQHLCLFVARPPLLVSWRARSRGHPWSLSPHPSV